MLTKIRGLRVVSRTSAFSFKGKDIDIPTVARRLNVAMILEGSVRKSGKRVRIATQLIQAATDSHLWSETYDRTLEDIFAVQDDIAQSVVKELRTALVGERPDAAARAQAKADVIAAAKGRSKNAEAHRAVSARRNSWWNDTRRMIRRKVSSTSGMHSSSIRSTRWPGPGWRAPTPTRQGLAGRHSQRPSSAPGQRRSAPGSGARSVRGPRRTGMDSDDLRLGLAGSRRVLCARVGARAGESPHCDRRLAPGGQSGTHGSCRCTGSPGSGARPAQRRCSGEPRAPMP